MGIKSNMKTGFLALALVAAGSLSATAVSAAKDGYGYENHGDYMKDMGERISRADKDFNETSPDEVDSDVEESWAEVKSEWNELEAATEEEWDFAEMHVDYMFMGDEKEARALALLRLCSGQQYQGSQRVSGSWVLHPAEIRGRLRRKDGI